MIDCWMLSIVFYAEPNWRVLTPCSLVVVVFHFSCHNDGKKPLLQVEKYA